MGSNLLKRKLIGHPDKGAYDVLSQLATGYLSQDYDEYGETPKDVLRYAQKELGHTNADRLREQLRRYLESRSNLNEAEFTEDYQETFNPDTPLEGWYGKTTRQWLELFHAMLSAAPERDTAL